MPAGTRASPNSSGSFKVDWTDRFLARGWPFAPSVALPPIDAAVARALKLPDGIQEGTDVAGRSVVKARAARLRHLLELAAMQGVTVTVEHYARIDASRTALPSRVKRGLLRLWAAAAVLWLGFVGVLAWSAPGATVDQLALVALAFPLAVLAASAALIKLGVWVWSGFQGGP